MAIDLSDDDLQQMYQEVILDAARAPHGKAHFVDNAPDEAAVGAGSASVLAEHEACLAARSHQFNPTCGDEVTIHVEISQQEPHTLERVVWDGQGCSISQASLSVMVDLVEKQSVEKAMALSDDFHQLMQSRGAGLHDASIEEDLGDAIVFQGVSRYPMRIKCALLGWAGLKASIAQALANMSEQEPAEKVDKALAENTADHGMKGPHD